MRISCLLLISLLSTAIISQVAIDPDKVIISASKIKSPKSEASKSTTVITAQEIKATPVSSVDELLRYYAGINVNQRGGFGVQTDVGIRGSTFSQVLWMLDGMRLNDPLTAHFNSYIPVTLEEIHHIEVVRGPGALSYGPDAVGGIIHIFTHAYMSRKGNDHKILSANGGLGSYGYQVGEIGIQYQKDKIGLTVSGRRQGATGETFDNPNFPQVATAPETYNNRFATNTVSGALNYFISDSVRLFIRGGYDHRDFDAKYFYTASTFDESQEETSSQWYQAVVEKKGQQQSRRAGISYRRTDDLFTFNPGIIPNEHTTSQVQAFYDYGVKVNEKMRFATGLQYLYRGITSTDRGDHDNFNVAGYTMAKGQQNRWRYTAGVRFEYFSSNGSYQAVPQASLSWLGDKVVVRSMVGRAYRAPDFTENFVSNQINNLSALRNLGNPDLRPESSWTMDLGIDIPVSSSLKIETTAFYRTSTSLIDYILTNSGDINNASNILPNTDYLYASNVSNADTYGVEMGLSGGITISDQSSLRGHLNFTYLETSVPDGTVSKYISNHPDLMANLMLELKLGKWSITTTNAFVSRDEELAPTIDGEIPESYLLTNMKLSYRNGNATIYAEGRNILDTQFQEILGAQMPGFWLLGGVRYTGGF